MKRSTDTTQKLNNLPAKKSGRAFSLMELLVVMGIIGLLASISLPMLGSQGVLGAQSFDASSHQIKALVETARMAAQAGNRFVWVGFAEVAGTPDGTLIGAAIATRSGAAIPSSEDDPFVPVANLVTLRGFCMSGSLSTLSTDALPKGITPLPNLADITLSSEDVKFSVVHDGKEVELKKMLRVTPSGEVDLWEEGRFSSLALAISRSISPSSVRAVIEIPRFHGETRIHQF